MKKRSAAIALILGLAAFAVSWALLARGVPFMKTWFYCFAWWSLILVLDAVNVLRTGVSPLASDVPGFAWTSLVSISVWLVFEAFNARLGNWSYHDVPSSLVVRWLGCAVAFATVIPALKELAALIQSFAKDRSFAKDKAGSARLRVTPALLRASSAAGVLTLALTLAAPRLFFPLVWVGFIFLVEPLNFRRGRPSFLRDLEAGRRGLILAWMAAGLAAGVIWESLNWFAGSHWEYHIPYLNFGRIFQMPVFGFGGFAVFALEVFALDAFLRGAYARLRLRRAGRIAFWAVLILFDAAVFALIDRFSVVF
jgi:hypothetical protein